MTKRMKFTRNERIYCPTMRIYRPAYWQRKLQVQPRLAFAHLVSVAATSSDNNSVTSSAIDTTGATLIIAEVADLAGALTTFTDSKGNTWNALTTYTSSNSNSRLFWSSPSSVGSGHTFTATGSNSFPSIAVTAWSGAAASPFDQQNGNSASSGVVSISTGSVTPTQDNELIVAGIAANTVAGNTFSINSSLTIRAQITSTNNISAGIATLVQTTAGAINPTWTAPAPFLDVGVSIATFKAAATGGGPLIEGGQLIKGVLVRGGRITT